MQEYGKRVEERGGLYLGVLDERWPTILVSVSLSEFRSCLSLHHGDDYEILNSKEKTICAKIDASTWP